MIIYFSYDADSAGNKIGRAILKDDLKGVKEISEKIHAGNQLVYRWTKEREGIQYSSGGDQGAYAIPEKYAADLEALRKDYEFLTGLTISVGTGKHLSESGQALLMAKLKGKNQIVNYDKETKKEIESIKKRAKTNKFKSMEEFKIASAYMEKNENLIPEQECQYCKQSDGVDSSHCKYCHGEEQTEQCKYCDENAGAADSAVAEADCQYCKEMDQQGQDTCKYCNEEAGESDLIAPQLGTGPDSKNESAPAGSPEEKELYSRMGMNPPVIGKPEPGDHMPIGQGTPMDVIPAGGDAGMESPGPEGKMDPRLNASGGTQIDPEDNSSSEALHLIADQILTEGTPNTEEVNAIDDSEVGSGMEAEGNISRPEGYAQNTPQDTGVEGPNPPAEPGDEPDYYGVLETGLDESANGIKKEKAIQIVSQALTQFKAAKMTLENIKMQAPDLYAASITMLKAMIEMASLMGLGPSGDMAQQGALGSEQAQLSPDQQPQEEQNDEWRDPFPLHPESGGTAKPEHAPSKTEESGSPQP